MFGLIGPNGTGFLRPQVRGFGVLHDGSVANVFTFLDAGPFNFRSRSGARGDAHPNVESFLLAFDTGLKPAVGQQVSLARAGASDPGVTARLDLLIARGTGRRLRAGRARRGRGRAARRALHRERAVPQRPRGGRAGVDNDAALSPPSRDRTGLHLRAARRRRAHGDRSRRRRTPRPRQSWTPCRSGGSDKLPADRRS